MNLLPSYSDKKIKLPGKGARRGAETEQQPGLRGSRGRGGMPDAGGAGGRGAIFNSRALLG